MKIDYRYCIRYDLDQKCDKCESHHKEGCWVNLYLNALQTPGANHKHLFFCWIKFLSCDAVWQRYAIEFYDKDLLQTFDKLCILR